MMHYQGLVDWGAVASWLRCSLVIIAVRFRSRLGTLTVCSQAEPALYQTVVEV